jgi:quercetin 2,3-dioxygenase
MIQINRSETAQKVRKGLFNIDINFPGINLNNASDQRGLAQLGRFDFAHLYPGVFVAMHQHQNDEILTYMREGEMIHEDSTGDKVTISNTRLMMMNAGSGFQHQESVVENGKEVKLLQIFIRPEKGNNKPNVSFHDFAEPYSLNNWRLIGGNDEATSPLVIQSKVNVLDTRLENYEMNLPNKVGKTYLLFVFSNAVSMQNGNILNEGDSLIYENESLHISSKNASDLVLFELDKNATIFRNGMYSGT